MKKVRRPAAAMLLLAFIVAIPASLPARAADTARSDAYYHYLLGNMKERARQYSDAIEHYREALKYDPSAPEIFARLADLYLQTNRVDEAVREAQNAIDQDPENKEPHKMLGQIYMEKLYASENNAQDLQKAISQFEAVRKIDPEDDYAILSLGQLYLQNNQAKEAADLLSRYANNNPDSHVAVMSLASAYQQLNQPDKALQYLLRYSRLNPQNLYILQQIADSYERSGNYQEALEFQKRAYEADSANPVTVRKYVDVLAKNNRHDDAIRILRQRMEEEPQKVEWSVLLAKTLQKAGDMEGAESFLKGRLGAVGDDLDVRLALVQLYEEQGKFPETIAQLQEMARSVLADPLMSEAEKKANLALVYSHTGFAYQQEKDYERSLEFYQKARTYVAPEEASKIDFYIALSYRGQKQYDKAIDVLNTIVQQNPEDSDTWELMSLIYEEKGDQANSDRIIQQLIDKQPNSPEYHLLRAQRMQQREKYKESIDYLKPLLVKFSANDELHFVIGAAYERLKDIDRAEEHFKKAIALNPFNANALNYLGYMLIDNGMRVEESIEYVKRALEIDRNNGAFLDSLGWGYFKLNQLDLAEDHLRLALQRLDDNAVVHDHMGDLYFKQGKFPEAIKHWEAALKTKSNEIDPAFIQKKINDTRSRMR